MQGLPGIFKVTPQNWAEWLVAIGIGAGSLPLAFLTKFISRCDYVLHSRLLFIKFFIPLTAIWSVTAVDGLHMCAHWCAYVTIFLQAQTEEERN